MTRLALSPAPEPTTTNEKPLAQLLRAAADEMFLLSELGGPLHALIERQMGGAGLQERSIEDAQLIDFLVQHLEATGIFLRQLAAQTPEETMVEFERVRAMVPLADLARRLGGEPPPEDSSASSGDLDLF
jgi:hypothetical protein